MTTFLITSDNNGFDISNPTCFLVETDIPTSFSLFSQILNKLEKTQSGAYRTGGKIIELQIDLFMAF